MSIVKRQEDSYFRDYKRKDGGILSVDWTGKWEIEDALGTTVASGDASLSVDDYSLEYRIKDTDTASLLGTYTVIFEITNAAIGFQLEEIVTIIFKEQYII